MTDTGAPPGPADQASALVRDGQALFAAGDVERSRECFERALALAPGLEEARVGLERCVHLLGTGARPAGDTLGGPGWTGGGNTDSEDSDLGAPEATVVDPMYVREAQQEVARLQASMTSGEFPEPSTQPSAPLPHMPPPTPGPSATIPAARISSLAPATQVSGDVVTNQEMPAIRPPAAPPVRVEPEYPRASAAATRHYPELLPGGRQRMPSSSHPAQTREPPPPAPPMMPSSAGPGPAFPTAPPGAAPFPPFPTPSPMGGPLPMPYFGRPQRWQLILAGVGAGAALVGFLIGMAVFKGGDDDGATPAAAGAPDAGPAPATPRALDAGVTPATPTPPTGPATQVIARATAITHPVLATVSAPFAGEVTRVNGKAGATVKRGAKLVTLRPTDKKRKDKEPATITAPDGGLFTPASEKGAVVAEDDVLGVLLDPSRHALTVDLPGDAVTLTWGCEAASADGASRAPCTLERLEKFPGAIRATASVAADAAPWLAQPGATATITLSPR